MAAEESVAVIGAGISGLASAYLLSLQGKKVTLYESEAECGGHALTVETDEFGPIDLGFQVCNMTTYPHLMGFLGALGVETEPSDMSFAMSTETVEWGSRGAAGIFAQPENKTSPKFLRMLYEILRFGREAPEVLDGAGAKRWAGKTLGDYLSAKGYSSFFQEHYVVPMCACIWSCSDEDSLAFPVTSLVRFWANHHLFDVLERPVWRVLKGRSRSYVTAVVAHLEGTGHEVLTGAAVTKVRRVAGGVEVHTPTGKRAFHDVVLATHTDVSLRLLGEEANADEAAALGAIRYQPNDIYLHTDLALMPKARGAWASWNCLKRDTPSTGASQPAGAVCVSYWVNLLQNLPEGARDVFVTLNPPDAPEAAKTLKKLSLAHPLLNQAALDAQASLSSGALQGVGGVWYAGAWASYGFHEDGIKSAVTMAKRLCASEHVTPWSPIPSVAHVSLIQKAFMHLFLSYGKAMLPSEAAIHLILPDGSNAVVGNAQAKPKDTAHIRVADASLFSKVVLRSDIGLGEAYMQGLFDTPDLFKLMEVLSRQSCGDEAKGRAMSALGWVGGALFSIFQRLEFAAHRANANTEAGSSANIAYHYDVGNAFYSLFLDKTMMYSSGVHKGLYEALEGVASYEKREAMLEEASLLKLDKMCDRADVQKGDHVLEIGCGWGSMAIRMAQRGAKVTGITLSHEQLAFAKERIKEEGLESLIEVVYCDYRRVHELASFPAAGYDKVVSIEMLEAVGHEHLHTYFDAVSRYLKPGGLAAVQVITIPDDRYEAYCNSNSDFIRAYIFPGGHLPSVGAMVNVSSRMGLQLEGCDNIGDDYAVTLRLWRERLMRQRKTVLELGYPASFLRMYEFYFAYCEAGFYNELTHDYQLTWRKSKFGAQPKDICHNAALEPPSSGLDPLTALLLVVFVGLNVALVSRQPHMASIPLSLTSMYLLRLGLGATGISDRRAATLANVAATAISTAAAAYLLYAVLAITPDAAGPAASGFGWGASSSPASSSPSASPLGTLQAALLEPSTPAPLLSAVRATVGAAAGFAAVRAWECVRGEHRRSLSEAFGYTLWLVCSTAAVAHAQYLVAITLLMLGEGHSLVLRLRTLTLQSGSRPSPLLWAGAWIAFLLLRLAPHVCLLTLWVSHKADLEVHGVNSYRLVVGGLAGSLINCFLTAWRMARAMTADYKAANVASRSTTAQWLADGTPTDMATSPPLSPVHALLSLAGLGACALATSVQDECFSLVTGTTVAYAAAYAVLRATGACQPAPGKISPAEMAEWRSRLLSTASAIILTVGALLCFSEWPYADTDGWISAKGAWSHPVTYASLFVGYLQWDVCWVLYHQASIPDVPSVVHHSLFIAITHYVLWGWYFKQPYAWLSVTELSTPFLNARWFYAVTGRKDGSLYSVVTFGFAGTFFLTRVLGYSLGVADLWRHQHIWKGANKGLYAVIAGVHAGLGLNLFWAVSVSKALQRELKRVFAPQKAKAQ